MKFNYLLKKFSNLVVVLIIIIISCILLKYSIALLQNTVILTETKMELFRNKMIPVIEDIMRQESFRNVFVVKNSYSNPLSGYYEVVLCHSLFVECFLDNSTKEILLSFKEQGAAESIKTLQELLLAYINNPPKVVNDILMKTLPLDFKIQSKQDIIMMLTEYAKLLAMSIDKTKTVTSDVFFKEFLANFNIDLYVQSDDYLKNNMVLLKKAYYDTIFSTKINEAIIVKDILVPILGQALKTYVHVALGLFDFLKEHYLLLLDPKEIFFNEQYFKQVYHIYNKIFMLEQYVFPPDHPYALVLFVDCSIIAVSLIILFL